MRQDYAMALDMYKAGATYNSIARALHVSEASARTYVAAAEHDIWANERRQRELEAAAAAPEGQQAMCASCQWRTGGTGICVLPRCFKEAK